MNVSALVGLVADDLLTSLQIGGSAPADVERELGRRLLALYVQVGASAVGATGALQDMSDDKTRAAVAQRYRQAGFDLRKDLALCGADPPIDWTGLSIKWLGGATGSEVQRLQLDDALKLLKVGQDFPPELLRTQNMRIPPEFSVDDAAKSVVREYNRVRSEVHLLSARNTDWNVVETISSHRMGAYASSDGAESWIAADIFTSLNFDTRPSDFARCCRVVTVYDSDERIIGLAQISLLEYFSVKPRDLLVDVVLGAPLNRTVTTASPLDDTVAVLDELYARPKSGERVLRYLMDLIYGGHRAFRFDREGPPPRWLMLEVLRGQSLKYNGPDARTSTVIKQLHAVINAAGATLGLPARTDFSVGINQYSRQVLFDFYQRAGFSVLSVKTKAGQPVSKHPDSIIRHYNADNVPLTLDESTLFMVIDLQKK